MAVSSMNVRRCIAATYVGPPFQAGLVMTRQAFERRLLLPVAVHAKPHVQIDDAFGGHLFADVAMALGALDLRPHVRRVVEAHMCRRRVAVDALPPEVDSSLLERGQLTDQRPVGCDL